MSLADEKYLLFTTFRRDGSAVSTPVWVISLDERRLGFWTSSASGKVKRLAHTNRVTVQPCDVRGNLRAGTGATSATAQLVIGPELDAIRSGVVAKYGLNTTLDRLRLAIKNRLKRERRPYGDRGVVVTLPR